MVAVKQMNFSLPDSSVSYPLIRDGIGMLNLGLVEIGCKPTRKRTQLKGKRQLLFKLWGDRYREEAGLFLMPVYRMLAHYTPGTHLPLIGHRSDLDVIVEYTHIPTSLLETLSREEKDRIVGAVSRYEREKTEVLEEILQTNDADRLHKLIVEGEKDLRQTIVRGKMAELVSLKDLQNQLPPGMALYWNEHINYFNRKYPEGTEVDGVQVFHGLSTYLQLIENLRKLDHLNVVDRWHCK